jgi:hypothetical protein
MIAEREEVAETELLTAAQEAANALADGGSPSLIAWAKNRSLESTVTLDVLVIDETGNELLGRSPPTVIRALPSSSEDFFAYDLPAVLLNLPTNSPEVRLFDSSPSIGAGASEYYVIFRSRF